MFFASSESRVLNRRQWGHWAVALAVALGAVLATTLRLTVSVAEENDTGLAKDNTCKPLP